MAGWQMRYQGTRNSLWVMALNLTRTRHRCSAGERCVSYAALGEPAKLSRGNAGPLCFACQERRAATTLKGSAKAKPAAGPGREEQASFAEGGDHRGADQPSPACEEGPCDKLAVEWQYGAHLCREHAEAGRAREWQEGRSRWVLSCESNLSSARSAGDEALARKWSRLLEEAEKRLAQAEVDLASAAARAAG